MRPFRAVLPAIVLAAELCGQTLPQKLTLQEASAIALRNNPRVALDSLAPLIANEITTEVRSALYPTVVANATGAGALNDSRIAAGQLNNPIIFNRLGMGTAASQLVTDFGRTSNLVSSARLRAQSQQEAVLATRAQILLAVHRAFYQALRAKNVLQVADQTLKSRQLLLEQVSALAQNNLKSTLDVSFAEVNVYEAKLAIASAQNEFDAAIADLSAVMGFQRPQKFEVAEGDLTDAPPPSAEELITQAIRSRPEVKSLQLELEAAGRFAKAEAKLAMPTVSALANVGVAPAHSDRMRGRYAAAGVNISVPVFNGHLFSARRNEAELRVQAFEQRLKDVENSISREVTLAALNAATAYQRIGLTAQLAKQAALSLDLAQERYNLGLSSFVEVNQAELNKTAADIRNATARYEYQMLVSAIEYQTGRLR